MLEKCMLCPRNCGINRSIGRRGFCKCDDKIKIALASKHMFEEPCISGKEGSGTIFFSNCNLNCVYCQNYKISQEGLGKQVNIERLAEIMIEQQARNVNNINLVTPTMYVYQIIEAIKIAKKNGLSIPIIYNSNGYENIETIKLLDGYIDVYLPDLKYYYDNIAVKYSNAANYFDIATKAIKEMCKQVGKTKLNEKGIITKGVVIRHLVLPNHIQNTKNILKWIKNNIDEEVYVSIMAQYFPTFKADKYDELNRKISFSEYNKVKKYVEIIGLKNGFIQDRGNNEEKYVPNFNYENI
ncbi:MAG: radical SAM protein [Clostridia bacterium]|nr:radical SAM protein [Clostridia bacterium]